MNNEFELADVIQALRENLEAAQVEGDDKNIRFNVSNVEVELQTVVKKGGDGNAKAKFWVLEAGTSAAYEKAAMQKIKLSLQAVDMTQTDPETGKPGGKVLVNDVVKR